MNPLVELAIVLVILGGAVGAAEWHGYTRGETSKQGEWDAAKVKADEEMAKKRDEGFVIAAELESDLHDLKGKYAIVLSQRKTALQQQVTCPASGQIGDLVVPAATVRSMLNIDVARPADGASAAKLTDALRSRTP